MDIIKIHDELLDFLWDFKKENPEFVFRLRKTNRGNKLSDGYWFLGNDDYLAIGFWEGMNWRTKMPNISFMIHPDERGSSLFINTSDSKYKTDFVENKLVKKLDLPISNSIPAFLKSYPDMSWREALQSFLYFDYYQINKEILELVNKSDSNDKLPFGIIDEDEFRINFKKILDYRLENSLFAKKARKVQPSRLKNFEIFNYGPIEEVFLRNIPENNQWIFITGENGVGKSSILKALAMAIGHRKMSDVETRENKGYEVRMDIVGNSEGSVTYSRKKNTGSKKIKPLTQGFAAYGPMRLQPIFNGLSPSILKVAKGKTGRFKSLFENDGYLLNIIDQFDSWMEKGINIIERQKEIGELLLNAMPNIGKVEMDYNLNEIPETLFHEIDSHGNLLNPVGFDKLSSGYLSIAAMMGDMLTRLFDQQPNVKDIADLRGVVIIDEIDIHLHPKFQKHFVEQLSIAFPNIQFIVSTHSPIPLLGAPKNSVVCVVTRDRDSGVKINRVDDKIYLEELLPNTILTSPIFGMDDITNENREKGSSIRTEESFEDIKFMNKLESKISEFLNNKKELALIERFKNKRK
tara:strand:+ start:12829 stop:14559 length:1731 start_codon:yes stop_codon:yes gene_type:complete